MTDKRVLSDLARLGGQPLFAEPLHVGGPNIGNRERFLERMNDLLDRRRLTNDGPYVQEFEQRVADFVGTQHCIATSNATTALEIVIRALKLRGEVIVPALTFVATAHALKWLGLTPVFCDVEPDTFTLDADRVEALIGPRTTAILGVHLWGHACQIDRLSETARRHRLQLFFDAAHAFGCSYQGRLVGGFGRAEVFSFHATKFCNAFEGGAITTDDDELAHELRLMRNFGFGGYDTVVSLGINGKLSEASAAMGLTSLESLDAFIEVNRRNYDHYARELADIPGLQLMEYDLSERRNFQYVVVEIDPAATGIGRDDLAALCWTENILARRYFYPGCHRMEPYRSDPKLRRGPLPVTEHAAQHLLTLPTGTGVGQAELRTLCEFLRFVVSHAPEISAALGLAPAISLQPVA